MERPRLLDDVLDASGPDVLLACAPAGYGKTTMLAGFAAQSRANGVPVAWVTCGRDDDALQFWSAVLTATADATGGEAASLTALSAPVGEADSAFVATLLDVLREEAPGLVLVLDDVHEVRRREVLDGIRHLVEWGDGSLRVALGCRFEPPVGLHRLRLTGRLHEVRAAQLAFTAAEADDFWDHHDLALDDHVRSALLTLTEGWPAGLRLAALALEGGDDPARFVEEFSGADRPVADYLTGEILARLPEEEVDFLLRTSVVEVLSVELAVRLSGREDAAAVLEDLAQRNALIARVDRGGTVFRYHSLLRTYLAAAMLRRAPDDTARLHATAARWFLTHDRPEAALEHASAARDDDLVDEVLRAQGLSLLLAGAGGAVRRALRALPPSGRGTRVALALRVLLAVDEGGVAEADEALAALARLPDDGTDRRVTSLRQAAVLHRARLASDAADARASELVADVGPSHLPADLDPDVRLLVLADRGALRLFGGSPAEAREDLLRAIDLAGAAGLPSIQLYCTNLVVGTFVAENDFAEARRAAERAIAFATRRGWHRSASMAYSYALAGWTAFQLLHPEEAASWAALGVDVIDTTIDVEVEGAARTGEAIIAFDDPRERRAAFHRLDRVTTWLTARTASPSLTAIAAPHELRMCLGLGEWQRAEATVARAERRLGPGGDATVLHAQLAAARGRTSDARRILAPVLAGRVVPLRATAVTTAWLIEAVIAQRADRHPAASEAVLAALTVSAPTGAARPFFDAGPEVHAMLAALRGRAGAQEAFLGTVLEGIADMVAWQAAAASVAAGGAPPAPTAHPTGGWLTERELDVLRDLPSMMTLGEIASAHGISLNTVKTHVRSIYAKLGASTRREAITTARGLGLL
ncbi:MAG TPA: LuxR C-terminal-related transcriptional regulator [Ornithinibacter sp.]|nr:LuxR C-terminal-related transcriptional regulator [Ornithinibacter sp.]